MNYEEMVMNRRRPLGTGLARAGAILAGQKPSDDDNYLEKIYAREAIQNQFKDPEEEALKQEDIRSRIDLRKKLGTFGEGDSPEGFTYVNGRLQKDPSYKRMPTPEERNIELNDEVAKNELTSMAKTLPKLDQAEQAAKQLETLFGQAVEPKSVKEGDLFGGLGYRIGQMPKTAMAFAGANPELNRYGANRKAFSGLISKGGFGEAGMLTESDIQRVASILPNEYSTKEEADIAWNEIKQILGSARKRFDEKKSQYTGGSPFDAMRTPSIGRNDGIPSFQSEQEAEASGYKGMALIAGKRARID